MISMNLVLLKLSFELLLSRDPCWYLGGMGQLDLGLQASIRPSPPLMTFSFGVTLLPTTHSTLSQTNFYFV